MIRSLLNKLFKPAKNLKNKISGMRRYKKSFSQCGEDILIEYIFNLRGIKKPGYLDVGANDPFFLSNTALFYAKGCSGINIEANPFLINNFKSARSKDININIGIGPAEDELDFYIINDPTLSTFSKEEAESITTTGTYFIQQVIKVKLTSIENIVEKYCGGKFPDLLSLDVEGLDFDILKTIDFNKHWPKIICVEAAEYSPRGDGKRKDYLIDFLKSKGYFEYANTNLNAIMVKNEFWNS